MTEPKIIDRIKGVPIIDVKSVVKPYIVSDGWLRSYHPDEPWDDGRFKQYYQVYEQVICKCGNEDLKVLYTNSYETSAYCDKCDRLWEVHTG